MHRVNSGQPERFTVLSARYFDVLVRVAESRLGSRELAEEAAQEALLSAFKSRHTYNPKFGFRTWLWTILLNACRREHKRSQRVPKVLAWSDVHSHGHEVRPSPDAELSPRSEQPLPKAMASEAHARLDAGLTQLRAEVADALRLRFYAALTFQEIAAATDCSLSTAKNRVKAGLTSLAELLRDEDASETDTNTPDKMSPPFDRNDCP